jgi:hypothetical protein
MRFHIVGHARDPMLPNEPSLQGTERIEAKLVEGIPDRGLQPARGPGPPVSPGRTTKTTSP